LFSNIKDPTVSVCMITYNHERYIHDAILGVLNQIVSFAVEFNIADDFSTDKTSSVLDSPDIKNHPNFHWINYVRRDWNMGMLSNFILAYSFTLGKYIALCEGDDYWTDPLKLQKQFDFLEANQEYSACFHKVNIIDENKNITGELPVNLNQSVFAFDDVVKGWFIPTSSLFFRRYKLYLPMTKFKNIISGDRMLVALLADYGSLKYMDENMGVYRKHPEGVSAQAESVKVLASNVTLFSQLRRYFRPKHKEVLQHQTFLWSGQLCRQYRNNKNYIMWFILLIKTAFFVHNFKDFKGYIKNFVLGRK